MSTTQRTGNQEQHGCSTSCLASVWRCPAVAKSALRLAFGPAQPASSQGMVHALPPSRLGVGPAVRGLLGTLARGLEGGQRCLTLQETALALTVFCTDLKIRTGSIFVVSGNSE